MNNYKVTGDFARISGGRVELTPAQAKTRTACIKHIEANIYEVLKPIQFKKGESFGCDGELNKTFVSTVEPSPKKASKKA